MSTESKGIKLQGYCVLTNTISGTELVWRTGEGEETLPQVFETERLAQLEIIADVEDDIEQFRDGDRKFDQIHWPENEYTVAKIVLYEDGEMMVYQGDDDAPQPVLLTTLQEWRDNL